MADITFKVENHQYSLPENFADLDNFTIQSCPRPYKVIWDQNENPYKTAHDLLQEDSNNVLLIDKNVYEIYFKSLDLDLSKVYLAEATEDFKTMNGVMSVVDFLVKNNFTKGEKLVVVGGGIIEDIGAFVGACFKRGINWIYFPTTLLSMCDSCIGGKTGINHNKAKNQMALFSAPSKVVININFLRTLNEKEIKSGLGEILKLLVTGGKECFELYKEKVSDGKVKKFEDLKPLILGSLWVKKAIVEHDEFELSHRRSLNYGHTIGHAIEVLTDYKIPHGQAVALGMVVVDKLSSNRSRLSEAERAEIKKYALDLLDKNMLLAIKTDDLLDLIQKDKKTVGNITSFVVIDSIGDMKFLKLALNSETITEIKQIFNDEIISQ